VYDCRSPKLKHWSAQMGTSPDRFQPIHFFRQDRFSSTFLATDQRLGRNEVVVKVLSKAWIRRDADLNSALLWYRGLRHSLISEVLDAGFTRAGDLYCVRQHLAPSEFFAAPALNRVKSLLSAVDFLYSKQRVHGSIKPANIFTTGPDVLLADPWVGLMPAGEQKSLTEEDVRFTAPEVLAGGPLAPQCDLYSLGAVLYRFFSGRDPFEDSDIETLKAKYLWASPRPLSTVSHVSREIGQMVGTLLQRDPYGRQAAFEALKKEFEVSETPAKRSPVIGIGRQIDETLRIVLRRGNLRVVVLEAPPGLGKSRLAVEVRSHAPFVDGRIEVRELKGRYVEKALAETMVSVVDERKLRLRSSSLSRVRDWLAEELKGEAASDKEANHRDLIALLAAVGSQVRLLLVIDDIDRSNKKALGFLESIVQQPVDLDLAILVTSRPLGVPEKTMNVLDKFLGRNLYQMRLDSLNSADSEELVSFFSGNPHRRVSAREKAVGNPLFLQAYSQDASGDRHAVVQDALSDMIQRIPERSRAIAETLSVFWHPIEWNVLINITSTPEAELREAVAPLHRIGLSSGQPPFIQYPDARILLESGLSKFKRMDLHATAFRCLRESKCNEVILAEHAFKGGLYEDAANLYRYLARERFDAKDRKKAEAYYAQTMECLRRDPKVLPLDAWDTVKLAISYGFIGKESAARRLLHDLLESEAVRHDAELLSAVYDALSSPLLEDSAEKRVEVMKKAISCLPEGATSLVRRYRLLAMIYLSVGDTAAAEKTLDEFKARSTKPDQLEELDDARASILALQGKFKAAADRYMSQQFKWTTPGMVSNNLAVCIEHLGNLSRARELQMLAHRQATGILFGEIMSLSNLGGMETKLGNMQEAKRYFSEALTRLEGVRTQGGDGSLSFGITYADAAVYFLHRGDFREAQRCMQQIDFDRRRPFFPLETLSILHTQYYLDVALGRRLKAQKVLEQARQLPLRGEFFEIEHLLAECRLQEATEDTCNRLEESVRVTQRIGTLYQQCQVLLALARAFFSLEETQRANKAARRARRLCRAQGYRLLEAEALLLVGLSSSRNVEKEYFLSRSLNESSQLGLAPLAAECAYRIGTWKLDVREFAAAYEHLSKSVSITDRLADRLTEKDRKPYRDLPNHRAAKELLKTASRSSVVPLELPELGGKEPSFFAELYRLVSAMTSAPNVDAAIRCLLEGLKKSTDYPVTVALGVGSNTTFHSLAGTVSEQKRHRILSMSLVAGNKTYISGVGVQQTRKTAVWSPLPSLTLPGCLYMECPGNRFAPEERQIEFLTLVGTIAGAVFDRLVAKLNRASRVSPPELNGIVGTSKRLGEIHGQIEMAATNDANVLIEGESGTGKELAARAIHSQSARAKGPFVAVDCGALPEALIEAELFGAKRGSYTGSLSDRVGLFEAAHKGTIFLDEISNLGLIAQAKLLRVLQDREVRQIGSTTGKIVDVRLIAATNCNVEKLVYQGKFRKDLLYRLKVLYLLMPPLRERKSDIPVLASTFLERLNSANQTQKFFGPAVMSKLTANNYPGNIRELQNIVERSFYSARGPVITQVSFLEENGSIPPAFDIEDWFKDLAEGRQDFWREVHDPYKRRDIPRERVIALVDYGLRVTRGSYKTMATKLQIPKEEYRRFMDFLRRSNCLLDFRPYRRMAE